MTTFKTGDRVRFNQKYGFSYKGDEGTVLRYDIDGLVHVKVDRGHHSNCFEHRIDLIEAKPKFKVGDRVVPKHGYAYESHQDKPLVVLAIEHGVYGVGPVGNDASKSHSSKGWYAYNESALELYAPTFEVGDYVEVWGYEVPSEKAAWEGRKGEVTSVGWAVVVKFDDFGKEPEGGFRSYNLRKAERPVKTALDNSAFSAGDKVTIVNNAKNSFEEVAQVRVWEGKKGVIAEEGHNKHFIQVDMDEEIAGVPQNKHLPFRADELKAYTPSPLEKHGYKVGDKVRPSGVNPEMTAGKFAALGGTIAEDQKNYNEYIVVTVDGHSSIYLPKEIELGEVEQFKAGDWVEVHGRGDRWDGTQGEVVGKLGGSSSAFFTIKDAEGESLQFRVDKLKLAERPKSKPIFSVGDWVEVFGHSGMWDGTQGEVIALPARNEDRITIKSDNGNLVYFYARALKLVKRPKPVFKVGDFVEVINGREKGAKAEIASIGEYTGLNYYRLIINGVMISYTYSELKLTERPVVKTVLDRAGVKVGDKVYWSGKNDALFEDFRENGGTVQGASTGGTYIRVTSADGTSVSLYPNEITLEKPVVKTWAEEAEAGDVFAVKGSDGKVNRFLTKTEENLWTIQYPNAKTTYTDWKNEDVDYFKVTKV